MRAIGAVKPITMEEDEWLEQMEEYDDQLIFDEEEYETNTQMDALSTVSNDSIKMNFTPQISEITVSTVGKVKKREVLKKSELDSTQSNYSNRPINLSKKYAKQRNKGGKKRVLHFLNEDICADAQIMIKQGVHEEIIRQRLNLTPRAIKKLMAQYELYGKLIPTKGSGNTPRQTIEKIEQFERAQQILKGLLAKNCTITLQQMHNVLKQNGIDKSRSTIHAYLEKMRYSRKKLTKIPLQRNSQNKLSYRQSYCKMIQQIPLSKQIFLDETIFGLQTAGHYGWAPKGQQPKVFVPASRRKHITLLAAISIKGFEGTKIIQGPVTSKHVCDFLEHQLDHIEPDQILILDNARMHHSAVVKQKIKQLKRNVRYLPAYTPQLNPIEMIFSQIKCQYVKLKDKQDLKGHQMIKYIAEAVKTMRSKQFSKFYEHYQQWLKKGAAGELFI